MEKVIVELTNPILGSFGDILRKKYDIYVNPMINVDGVVSGNYRVNLSGFDLNRTYHDPSPNLHPPTFAYKNFMLELKKK